MFGVHFKIGARRFFSHRIQPQMMHFPRLGAFALGIGSVILLDPATSPLRWGDHGHRLVGEAAASNLPASMPAFFRNAGAQLTYLNPEPDRWRDRGEEFSDPAMNGAHSPEHYIDLEWVPATALKAPHRYAFLDSLKAAGVKESPGLLPYRMLELTQRLRVEFKLWRASVDSQQRKAIEARILNDAGILGHYVADGANPHHTSEHHNGWIGDNPNGYATDKNFHSRFESWYVQRNIRIAEVKAAMTQPVTLRAPARDSIMAYLRRSHTELQRLYEIDKRARFDSNTVARENRDFATQRLAAGAEMLRDLWWTAWITSDIKPQPREKP
jgi:hypothetical protein